jgi:hypothetical protein
LELPARPAAAALPLALFGAVLAWWAWERGAFFGVEFYPGTLALLGLLGALLAFAPFPGRLRGPVRLALAALLGLCAWTLLSTAWSPAKDVAIDDGFRVLAYAVGFMIGLWVCLLLGRRMLLSLAAVAGAVGVIAVATLIALWVSDNSRELLEIDGTIRYPLGYRNAVAAFFIMGLWPMVVLAASRDLDPRLRAGLTGIGTLCIELTVLAQSRGSVFAAGVAALVLVALHPDRLRVVAWLALAAVPAALALPWLLDVYSQGGSNGSETLAPLHTACAVIAGTTGLSCLVAALTIRSEDRINPSARTRRMIGIALGVVVGAIVLAGVVSVAKTGSGVTDELTAGTPDLQDEGSRFGLDLRTDRGDFWRVALDDFKANPVAGEGAGGFRFSYLKDRRSSLQPEDPHSVEMVMAGELGLPGLALFVTFVIAAIVAALRARRLGPSAATLCAASMAIAAYWLVHASVEWFWPYPALVLPVTFALGAAAAPAALRPTSSYRRPTRLALLAVTGLAALVMLPVFLGVRYTDQALHSWNSDLQGAYDKLHDAADLNPLSDRPLTTEAVIAEQNDDPQRALRALAEAEQREPDEWTLYFLEARLLAPIDPPAAARALATARELNPKGTELDGLERQLQGQ